MANIKSTLAKQLADALGKSVSPKNADKAADAIAAVRQRNTKTPVANLEDAEKLADLEKAEKLIDSDTGLKKWKELNTLPESQRQKNIPEAQKAAEDLYEGKITSQESRKRIKEIFPETELYTAETMPEMPSVTDTVGSMGKKAKRVGIINVKGFDLEPGERVGARLDIPAYNNYNKWIVSIHDGKSLSGKSKGYAQAIRLKNIEFGSKPKEALNIAKGGNKATIARMFGDYQPQDPYELQKLAKEILQEKNSEWTQVGMNPYRGSYFYDKVTGMPVTKADEVIQVGPLVLAKNVQGLGQKVKPPLSEIKNLFDSSAARTKDGKVRIFNEGGMAKQMEMFDTEEVTSAEVPTEEGGLMDEGGAIDEVSGNDVPVGSLKEEVRDDIPAQLSEGEFVLPADVVRYHGLDKIMRLRDEAKIGLARMEAMGQMGNSEEAVIPDDVPFSLDDLDLEEDAVANDTLEMNVGGLVPQQQPYGVVQPPQVGTPNYATGTYQMPSAFANYQQQFVQPAPVQQPQINTAPIQPLVPTYTQPVPEQSQYSFSELMPRTVDMETKNALGRTTAGNIDYSGSLYSGTGLGDEKKGSSVVGDLAKTAAVGYGLQKLGVDNFIGSGVEKGIAKAGTFLKGLGGKSAVTTLMPKAVEQAAYTGLKSFVVPSGQVLSLGYKDAVAQGFIKGAGGKTFGGKVLGGKALGGKALGMKGLITKGGQIGTALALAYGIYDGVFNQPPSAGERATLYQKKLGKQRLEDQGFYAYRDAVESFTGMDYGDYIKSITPPRNPYQMATDNLPKTDDGFQEEEMLMNYYKNTTRGQKEMSDFYAANPEFFTPTGERVFPKGPLGDIQRAAQEYRQSGGKSGLSPTMIVNQMAKDGKLIDAMSNHPEAFKEAIEVGSQYVTEEDIAEVEKNIQENPEATV